MRPFLCASDTRYVACRFWEATILKVVTQGELKRSLTARTKKFPGSTQGLVELGGRDVIEETRVVVVIKATNVRDVEQVEYFRNESHVLLVT